MHTKIIDLINILVKMSGQKDNIKNLNDELQYLDNLLPELNKELEVLTQSISDDKYFDASSEIIDRNIEISLKKKISNLTEVLKKQKEKIEVLKQKTEQATEKCDLLNKRIVSCETFINILNSRLQTENDNEGDSKYLKLLEQEKKRYDALTDEINQALIQKEELMNTLSEQENVKEEIESNLDNENNQLQDVQRSLSNKSSYVDILKKEEDISKVKELELKIKNTKNRKEEILNSIVYTAERAKTILLNKEIDKKPFMESISEITNELNTYPYLKIEDEAILREELRQLESKKDELTTIIENKKYTSSDINFIEERLSYLEEKINILNKEIDAYKSIENIIDNEEITKLTDILIGLREQAKDYEFSFSAHENDKKSNVPQESELEKYNILNELITNYENDLQDAIALSNRLNNQYIINCEKKLVKIREEKDCLNKKKLLHSDSVNLIEKEKDRKELKAILENIENLNMRLNINITPNQVLDQIEMLLFAGEESKTDPEEKVEIEETSVIDSQVIKNLNVNEDKIESIPTLELDEEPEFTFEKLPDEPKPIFETINPEDIFVSLPETNITSDLITESDDDTKDFSFSPLDNTGFMSFEDAVNAVNNK